MIPNSINLLMGSKRGVNFCKVAKIFCLNSVSCFSLLRLLNKSSIIDNEFDFINK